MSYMGEAAAMLRKAREDNATLAAHPAVADSFELQQSVAECYLRIAEGFITLAAIENGTPATMTYQLPAGDTLASPEPS